jgi:hypothetical protein
MLPGRPPPRETRETASIFRFHFRERPVADLLLRNENEIEAADGVALVAPKALAQEPLRAVSNRGASHTAAGGESHTRHVQLVLDHEQREERPVQPQPFSEYLPKVRGRSKTLSRPKRRRAQPGSLRNYAAIRRRPFCRRRFRTRRPPFVRIRTRKPCVLLRFRLFG